MVCETCEKTKQLLAIVCLKCHSFEKFVEGNPEDVNALIEADFIALHSGLCNFTFEESDQYIYYAKNPKKEVLEHSH